MTPAGPEQVQQVDLVSEDGLRNDAGTHVMPQVDFEDFVQLFSVS